VSSTPVRARGARHPEWREPFRNWLRSRPFWAGVWTMLAGLEILSIPLAPLTLMVHEGVAGVAGGLMGLFLVILAISLWLAPAHRVFAGIGTLVFSVASLVLSNFGGFLLGFLLGVIGGAMAVSWAQDDTPQPPKSHPTPGGGGSPGGGAVSTGSGGTETGGAHRSARHDWLRALGVLPVGALLAGGVQPLPAPAVGAGLAQPLNPPVGASAADGSGESNLTACSLLDSLLTTSGPATRAPSNEPPPAGRPDSHGVDQHRDHPPHQHGGQPKAHLGTKLPGQRTQESAPGPSSVPKDPEHSHHQAGGGLLGAVSGLLGLDPAPAPSAPSMRSQTPTPGPTRPVAQNSHSRTAPTAPPSHESGAPHQSASLPRHTPSNSHAGNGNADERPTDNGDAKSDTLLPGVLNLRLPALTRAASGLDDLLRQLPQQLDIDHVNPQSRWCAPNPSLDLSPDAGAYRRGAAAAQPFRVRTPLLVFTGLTFHGITEVPTRYGPPQRVLAFTASRADILGPRQTAPLLPPSCGPFRPDAADHPPFTGIPGSRLPLLGLGVPGIGRVSPVPGPWLPCQRLREQVSPASRIMTVSGGPVVLLSKVLSGNLLGLFPVTFTPDMPPPLPPGLTLPIPIFFTDVTAYNQYASADTETIPDAREVVTR
jgi:hypothetical protein